MSRLSIMSDYIIRDARVEDCGEIFLMLKELQEHLKVLDHMTLEEEALKNDGFGEDKFFQCIVAEEKPSGDDKPALVGYLLYFWAYSTSAGRMMVVEDFYVRQSYRTQGTGSALWAHATKVALEKGCVKVEWIVHDWNVQAIKFYKKLGGVDMSKGGDKPALVGYLLYFWAYSTSAGRMMVVEDFYVRQSYRTQGTGSALWAHATKVALEKGCRKVEWIVHDWNVQAIKFYKKLGGVDMSKGEGWLVYSLDVNAMRSVVATDTVNKQ